MRVEFLKRERSQINLFPRMSDVELRRALAVGIEMEWFRAITQIIEDHRQDAIDAAAVHVASNNDLATFGAVGAQEVLKTLLEDLNNRRANAVADKT
jgi:hypothetical protein